MKKNLTLTVLAAMAMLVISSLTYAEDEYVENVYGKGTQFGRVVLVQGDVYVGRDAYEMEEVEQNFALNSLDTLVTEEDSRVVVQFADGTLLKIGENSKVDFPQLGGDTDEQFNLLLRLWQGRLFIDIVEHEEFKDREFRVDTEEATVFILSEGKYRIDKTSYETKVKNTSGLAEVSVDDGSKLVHSGEAAHVGSQSSFISVRVFNTLRMDDFDLWAANTYKRRNSVSAEYVPADIRHYVYEMDTHGNWYYDNDVDTYIWRPYSVAYDWTPYSYGRWAWSPYGSSWVSYHPWGYAPFHYGSWHFSVSFGWCWMPGRYYSPAHVVWNTWDHHIGWYPYSRYHHRHGRRVADNLRGRVLCTNINNMYGRRVTVNRMTVPSNRTVLRTTRPIAPKPDRIKGNPVKAMSSAIRNPVSREGVRIETSRIKTVTRIDSQIKPGRTTAVHSSSSDSRRIKVSGSDNVKTRGISSPSSSTIKRSNSGVSREVSKPVIKRGTTIKSGSSSSSPIIKRNTQSSTVKTERVRKPMVKSGSSSSSSSGRSISIKKPGSSSSRSYARPSGSSSGSTVKRTIKAPSSSSRSSSYSSSGVKSYTKPSSSRVKVPTKSSSGVKSYSKPSTTRRSTPPKSSSTSSGSSSSSSSKSRTVKRK